MPNTLTIAERIHRTDLRMWEDELIYQEIEEGRCPWIFTSTPDDES